MRPLKLNQRIRQTFMIWGVFPLLATLGVTGAIQIAWIARTDAEYLTERLTASQSRWEQAVLRDDSVQLIQEVRSLVMSENWSCGLMVDERNTVIASFPRTEWVGLSQGAIGCANKVWSFPISSRGRYQLYWSPRWLTNGVKLAVSGIFLIAAATGTLILLLNRLNQKVNRYVLGVSHAIELLKGEPSVAMVNGPLKSDLEFEELMTLREALARQIKHQGQMARSQAALAAADARALLADQVAHDIRSPVGVLKMIQSQLTEIDPELQWLLNSVIERISGIADALLEDRRPRQASMGSWLNGFISEKRLAMQSSGLMHRLEVNFISHVEHVVPLMDTVSLQRVLSNLLNNALEALGASAGLVRVGFTWLENSETLRITIEDSGPGFPAAMLSRDLTQPLMSSKIGGHGLGLSGSARLISDGGGKLTLKNGGDLGGASVLIELPAIES